jgi:hypothetical protein
LPKPPSLKSRVLRSSKRSKKGPPLPPVEVREVAVEVAVATDAEAMVVTVVASAEIVVAVVVAVVAAAVPKVAPKVVKDAVAVVVKDPELQYQLVKARLRFLELRSMLNTRKDAVVVAQDSKASPVSMIILMIAMMVPAVVSVETRRVALEKATGVSPMVRQSKLKVVRLPALMLPLEESVSQENQESQESQRNQENQGNPVNPRLRKLRFQKLLRRKSASLLMIMRHKRRPSLKVFTRRSRVVNTRRLMPRTSRSLNSLTTKDKLPSKLSLQVVNPTLLRPTRVLNFSVSKLLRMMVMSSNPAEVVVVAEVAAVATVPARTDPKLNVEAARPPSLLVTTKTSQLYEK